MEELLMAAAQNSPGLKYELKVTFSRNAFGIAKDHPLVTLLAGGYKTVAGKEVKLRFAPVILSVPQVSRASFRYQDSGMCDFHRTVACCASPQNITP
jgi:hypothetical protein